MLPESQLQRRQGRGRLSSLRSLGWLRHRVVVRGLPRTLSYSAKRVLYAEGVLRVLRTPIAAQAARYPARLFGRVLAVYSEGVAQRLLAPRVNIKSM